jgi:hypothetical protein
MAGGAELQAWMSELLEHPYKEYPRFVTALSLLPALSPEAVKTLLGRRLGLLADQIDTLRTNLARSKAHMPELFSIENAYRLAMTQAEHDFVRTLLDRLHSGDFSGLDGWNKMFATAGAGLPDPQLVADAFNFPAGLD